MTIKKFLKKKLFISRNTTCEEMVLFKNKIIHLSHGAENQTLFYVVNGTVIFYLLDDSLKLLSSVPLVSGEAFCIPDGTKTFLIESLAVSDQDLKLLKYSTRID